LLLHGRVYMSSKRPPSKEVLAKIIALEKKIDKLYEQKSQLKRMLVEKYGTTDFVYPLDKPTEEGHRYLKLKIVDNLAAFEAGVCLFKSVGIERNHYELNYLKHEPKPKE
jgi:hypothetical protein